MTGTEREALRERIALERWARVELSRCMGRIWSDLAKAESRARGLAEAYARGVATAVEWHSRSHYSKGCRCPDCRRVHTEAQRAYRARQRAAA